MAENTPRSLQDTPSSSPDENEFPFGYPTNICEDAPGQKFLCSNCNNILKKALQTLCGHRYCSACLTWIVRYVLGCARALPASPGLGDSARISVLGCRMLAASSLICDKIILI